MKNFKSFKKIGDRDSRIRMPYFFHFRAQRELVIFLVTYRFQSSTCVTEYKVVFFCLNFIEHFYIPEISRSCNFNIMPLKTMKHETIAVHNVKWYKCEEWE